MIANRLQRVGRWNRNLVPAAAVIGRECDFSLLRRAAGLGERAAAEGLEELVNRRLLHCVEGRFDFTHETVRRVALAEILPLHRKLLHRRVAAELERLHAANPEPHALALGVHYREGEVWDKAVHYLRRAGTQAWAHAANLEAEAAYEQALDALAHQPETRQTIEQGIDIRLELHKAMIPLGKHARLSRRLLEAENWASALGDHARSGRIAAQLANCFWLGGELDRAVESGERACAIAKALDDRALRIAAGFYLGQAYHFRGDFRKAIAVLRGNLEALVDGVTDDQFGLPGLAVALSSGWLCWSLSETGAFAEGRGLGEEAVRIAEAANHAFSRADAYRELGCLHLGQGDIRAATTVLERGLDLCRTRELELWFPSIGSALGYAFALSGKLEEATRLLRQAIERANSLGISAGRPIRGAWLAEAYLLGGRVTDALSVARDALEQSQVSKQRGSQAWVMRLLGDIASQCDPPVNAEAGDAYRRAMDLGEELGMWPLVAHCHFALGRLYLRTERPRDAQEHLTTATSMYRTMDMRLWLEQAELGMTARS
jgi:tetratricopeptide (TPR) repeat protein